MRSAVPETMGPTYLVVCRLLPEVANIVAHLRPDMATCSSNASELAADKARTTKHMPTNNLTNLGGMLPINLYHSDLLGSAEIQLHIDPGCGIWR